MPHRHKAKIILHKRRVSVLFRLKEVEEALCIIIALSSVMSCSEVSSFFHTDRKSALSAPTQAHLLLPQVVGFVMEFFLHQERLNVYGSSPYSHSQAHGWKEPQSWRLGAWIDALQGHKILIGFKPRRHREDSSSFRQRPTRQLFFF